jgi:hypothetical protein
MGDPKNHAVKIERALLFQALASKLAGRRRSPAARGNELSIL